MPWSGYVGVAPLVLGSRGHGARRGLGSPRQAQPAPTVAPPRLLTTVTNLELGQRRDVSTANLVARNN